MLHRWQECQRWTAGGVTAKHTFLQGLDGRRVLLLILWTQRRSVSLQSCSTENLVSGDATLRSGCQDCLYLAKTLDTGESDDMAASIGTAPPKKSSQGEYLHRHIDQRRRKDAGGEGFTVKVGVAQPAAHIEKSPSDDAPSDSLQQSDAQ